MFEPAEEGDVRPDDVRSAARARLSSIMVEFPVRRLEDGFRRATRLAPGVYRTAGLPPAVSVGGFAAADRSPGDDRRSADRPRQADEAPTPGPTTAAVLNRLVPGAVSSHDLLDGIAGWEQLISWAQARQVEFVAEFARRRPGPYAPDEPSGRVSEFAADEIAARLRVTRRAAEIKLSLAVDLADRLPGTEAALQAGRIDLGKAKAIAELTANLAVGEALAVVEERVLRRSGEQTVPELRRSLLRAVARVDPAANAKRNHQARAERFLRVQPCRNGMAELTGRMPAEDAMTVFGAPDDPRRSIPAAWTPWWTCAGPGGPARIRRAGRTTVALRRPMARSRLRPDRGRAGRRGRGGPEVRLVVAAGTLLGLDDRPGELAGFGPIDAETVRRIAADPDGTWRRLVIDPVSGTLLDYGTTVNRPPGSLARHVRARDQVCAFPGCRQPADRCDLDHGVPFPAGPTCEANLIPLCRHHHRAKTHPVRPTGRRPPSSRRSAITPTARRPTTV